MKTWHWIVIAGAALVVGYVFWRRRATSAAPVTIGDKVGTGIDDAGAPPLPNVAPANPATATILTFTRTNSFGKRFL